MEVGTAKPITKKKKKKLKKRPNFSRGSGFGSNGGDNDNGGGGGNNDGNKPEEQDFDSITPEPIDKSKILMWFLLLIVLMTFGGLIGAYVFIATNKAVEWRPFLQLKTFAQLPTQVWISTAIILGSSITYHIAKNHLLNDQNEKAKKWFLVTGVLGAFFISSQIIVWMGLVNQGVYMTGNPYAGFFYILTVTHSIHVLGGITALGYIILRIWNKSFSSKIIEKRKNEATSIGWYWHTMDVLWLVLLFLLAFFK